MVIKIKLSTGKEIELTQEEYAELVERSNTLEKQRVPDYLYFHYPSVYYYITCGTCISTCKHN